MEAMLHAHSKFQDQSESAKLNPEIDIELKKKQDKHPLRATYDDTPKCSIATKSTRIR